MAEKKFGKRTFQQGHMLATEAMVMQARLLKIAGPAIGRLGEIFAGFGPDKTEEEKNRSNVAAIMAFSNIFANSDPEELAGLIKDLIEVTQIKRENGDYTKTDFDGDFTGQTADIVPVVVWVIREQFGDFFSGVLAIGNLK